MAESSPMINDKTIDKVTFITAKPFLQRLDVSPFVVLYSLTVGGYLNTVQEWTQITMMIAILLAVVIHAVVLLAGYWHVTFRVKIAYNTHTKEEVLKAFNRFDQDRYTTGIRYAQEEYEGQLTAYKLWYTFYDKKLIASKMSHDKHVQMYNANPNNMIPPGPFIPPEPPAVPQMQNPVVIFNNSLLEVCIVPQKHHGNPTISRVSFSVADNTRVQHSIQGLLTHKEVIKGAIVNNNSQVLITGPKCYPPFQFSHHHAQYTMDLTPNLTSSPSSQQQQQQQQQSAPISSPQFTSLPYPDNDKLSNYLTHQYTSSTPTPGPEGLQLVQDAQQRGISSQPISTSKNSVTMSDLFRTASSSISSSYRLLQFGFNSLTVPIPSFFALFIENAMSPFFVFQIACVLLWMLDEYWYYSLFTLVMLVVIECVMVYKRQSHLTQMLGEKPPLPFVHVYRRFETSIQTSNGFQSQFETDLSTSTTTTSSNKINNNKNDSNNGTPLGSWVFTPTKQLVPGDIVALPIYTDSRQINTVFGSPNATESSQINLNSTEFIDKSVRPTLFTTDIPCDMLLLSGSCVCDESMLSGESVPQVKEDLISLQTSKDDCDIDSIDNDGLGQYLDDKIHKRYQLYSGTKLIGIQRNYQHSFFSAPIHTTTTTTTTTTINKTITKPMKSKVKPLPKQTNPDDIDGIDQDDGDDDADNEEIDQIDENLLENTKTEAEFLADKRENFLTLTSRPPLPNGAEVILCRVLRTGFSTTQGSLVRTILTASDNSLVDKEALYFILGLLFCAIISAYFVIVEGLADQTRSRYKLLLNVITILTSVVPPELPLQLSMAVNNALGSLAKTQVFCTEPNRLPSAGQIDICCFDKTGTLQADIFVLACAVTPDNQSTTTTDIEYVKMQLDEVNIDIDQSSQRNQNKNDDDQDDDFVVDGSDDSSNIESSKESDRSLNLRNLPIDTRIILGCAQELAMLQIPPKTTIGEDGQPKVKESSQRIVGDPMEAVGFTTAGFKFFPRQNQNSPPSSPQANNNNNDKANVNNKVFCEASPVKFDKKQQKYIDSSSSQKSSKLQKMRFDTEILHRFTFQSQLQRMSSIVSITPPPGRSPQNEFNDVLAADQSINWLNSTLPKQLQTDASKTLLRVVVKGSPEMVYNSLHPEYRPDFKEYTRQHKALARSGLRVLALAWKPLFVDTKTQLLCNIPDQKIHSQHDDTSKGSLDAFQDWSRKHPRGTISQFNSTLKIPQRDQCETGLFFAGIIGFNSPLKTQTAEVITHLQQSNHKTIMITGDHLLTAIAVAKSLNIAKSRCLLLSKQFIDSAGGLMSPTSPGGGSGLPPSVKLVWKDEFEQYVSDFDPKDTLFTKIYDKTDTNTSLCINGDSLTTAIEQYPLSLPLLCTVTSVFARTLPNQKELILKFLREYNNSSQTCLMCGDGTNDVGALTHANIGIALSSIDTDSKEQLEAQEQRYQEMYRNPIIKKYLENAQKLREKGFVPQAEAIEKQANDMFKRLQQSKLGSLAGGMMEMDMEDDDPGSVKLGDASLAASFSAKHGSIRCVLDVIRQGRCALATTGQMYQILALQCLIAAYSLSALYFQGVRQSESQMTVGGIVATAMSTLLSYAQPLEKVSPRRPNSKIFSPYNISTIGLQFIVHLSLLMYMVNYSMEFTDIDTLKQGQDETITKYIPSVLNSVVFILSTAMSATTILSNYVGFPFMTPLTWTKLFKVIIGTIVACVFLSLEIVPEFNSMLEMSPMPNEEFSVILAGIIIIDCIICVLIGLGTKLFFGIVTWDDLTKPIPKDVIAHAMTSSGPAGLQMVKRSQDINNTITNATASKKNPKTKVKRD